MTNEEKEEIKTIVREAIMEELGEHLEKEKLMKLLKKAYIKSESVRPYLCSELKCRNRKNCGL